MPTPKPAKSQSLDAVFDALYALLSRYTPPLKRTELKHKDAPEVRGKRSANFAVPHPVVIPGAYGGKPTELCVGSLIIQKDFVGFYYMPIYCEPALAKKLSPALMKLLKGKTCFHVKTLNDELLQSIDAAIREGIALYTKRGWL